MVNAQAEQVFGYARDEHAGPAGRDAGAGAVPARIIRACGSRSSPIRKSRPMGAGRDLYGLAQGRQRVPGRDRPQSDRDRGRTDGAVRHRRHLRSQAEGRAHPAGAQGKGRAAGRGPPSREEQPADRAQPARSAIVAYHRPHRPRHAAGQPEPHSVHGPDPSDAVQSKDFAKVDFSRFLDSLVPTLVGSYGVNPDRIALLVQAEQVLFPINAAIPCGLIVNELISNALKHAFPDGRGGEIRVGLSTEPDGATVVLSVADDGVGIPEGVEPAQDQHARPAARELAVGPARRQDRHEAVGPD